MAVSFIYPPYGNFSDVNNGAMINVFDSLSVEYNSTFPGVNITLFCTTSTTDTLYYYDNSAANPLLPSGTCNFGSIADADFPVTQYPVPCSFKLTQYGDNDNALGGEIFWVTSQAGTSTTFQPTSSATTVTTSSSVQTSATTTPTVTLAQASASSTSATTSATSSATSSPIVAASGSLSTGADAGIGIGVAAAVLILAAAIWFLIRRTRRRAPAEMVQHNNDKLESMSYAPALVDHKISSAYVGVSEFAHNQPERSELEDSSRAELYDARSDPTNPHELYANGP